MSTFTTSQQPNSFNRLITLVIGFCIAFLALTAVAYGQIDGFTAPFRKIDLSSDETGSIAELLVEEAQIVRDGEPIARLDSRVQELQLEIADRCVYFLLQSDCGCQ